ncbi:MAG: hypothetical protein SFV81_27385 [Pirellulaceae bacterium]|nr:hypothetical protein [Pirellulaceae bacterium]
MSTPKPFACYHCGSSEHTVGKYPDIKCPWRKAGVNKDEATRAVAAGVAAPGAPNSPYGGGTAVSPSPARGGAGDVGWHEAELDKKFGEIKSLIGQMVELKARQVAQERLAALTGSMLAAFAAPAPVRRERDGEEAQVVAAAGGGGEPRQPSPVAGAE